MILSLPENFKLNRVGIKIQMTIKVQKTQTKQQFSGDLNYNFQSKHDFIKTELKILDCNALGSLLKFSSQSELPSRHKLSLNFENQS